MTRLGRYGETTTWITVALLDGPLGAIRLLDRVRELDGLVRPGTFYGAVARLERRSIIAPVTIEGRAGYRLVPSIPRDGSGTGVPHVRESISSAAPSMRPSTRRNTGRGLAIGTGDRVAASMWFIGAFLARAPICVAVCGTLLDAPARGAQPLPA